MAFVEGGGKTRKTPVPGDGVGGVKISPLGGAPGGVAAASSLSGAWDTPWVVGGTCWDFSHSQGESYSMQLTGQLHLNKGNVIHCPGNLKLALWS